MLPEFGSPVVAFMDESATDAKDNDAAVLAGIVINRKALPAFNTAWNAALAKHKFRSPLHMIELGPKGPNPHVVGDEAAALLAGAVAVINEHRIFTFGASWDNRKHEGHFSQEVRERYFSVYGFTFLMAVEINRGMAVRHNYGGVVDYVLDDGNRYKRQISAMHDSIHMLPQLSEHPVGSLSFGTDTQLPGLQAADVVAWATRRRKAGKPLGGIHRSLTSLFDQSYADSPAPGDRVKLLAERFALYQQGIDPGPLPISRAGLRRL